MICEDEDAIDEPLKAIHGLKVTIHGPQEKPDAFEDTFDEVHGTLYRPEIIFDKG